MKKAFLIILGVVLQISLAYCQNYSKPTVGFSISLPNNWQQTKQSSPKHLAIYNGYSNPCSYLLYKFSHQTLINQRISIWARPHFEAIPKEEGIQKWAKETLNGVFNIPEKDVNFNIDYFKYKNANWRFVKFTNIDEVFLRNMSDLGRECGREKEILEIVNEIISTDGKKDDIAKKKYAILAYQTIQNNYIFDVFFTVEEKDLTSLISESQKIIQNIKFSTPTVIDDIVNDFKSLNFCRIAIPEKYTCDNGALKTDNVFKQVFSAFINYDTNLKSMETVKYNAGIAKQPYLSNSKVKPEILNSGVWEKYPKDVFYVKLRAYKQTLYLFYILQANGSFVVKIYLPTILESKLESSFLYMIEESIIK